MRNIKQAQASLPPYVDLFLINAIYEGGLAAYTLFNPAFMFGPANSPSAGAAATIAAVAALSLAIASFWARPARITDIGKQAVALGCMIYHGLVAALMPMQEMRAVYSNALGTAHKWGMGHLSNLAGIGAISGRLFHGVLALAFAWNLYQAWAAPRLGHAASTGGPTQGQVR